MIEGLPALQARLKAIGQTNQQLRLIGLETVRGAKLTVARKTGTTARTIRLSKVTDTEAVIEAGGAAAYLEVGTRPHIIRPKSKRVLRFPAQGTATTLGGRVRAGGKYAFAKVVHHPGTKPQPFLVPSARKALLRFGITGIVERWNKAA